MCTGRIYAVIYLYLSYAMLSRSQAGCVILHYIIQVHSQKVGRVIYKGPLWCLASCVATAPSSDENGSMFFSAVRSGSECWNFLLML